MTQTATVKTPVMFAPRLRAADEWANYWLRQVMLRLRREVCWLWQERGLTPPGDAATLPPFIDKTNETLDLARFHDAKQQFWTRDVTAGYLTAELSANPPPTLKHPLRGTFGWLIKELQLAEVETFALAAALTTAFDSNSGSVIACCLNDHSQTQPNLRLLQRLWDEPEQVLTLADPAHPLFSYGLLRRAGESQTRANSLWGQPLTVPLEVARQLLLDDAKLPACLTLIAPIDEPLPPTARFVAAGLNRQDAPRLRAIPLLGADSEAQQELCGAFARATGRAAYKFTGSETLLEDGGYLDGLATLCWLRGADLLLQCKPAARDGHAGPRNEGLPLATIPVNVFLAAADRQQLEHIAPDLLEPGVAIEPFQYAARVQYWVSELGDKAPLDNSLLAETARRFRFGKTIIKKVCQGLRALPDRLTADDLTAACRAALNLELGDLASPVAPRFTEERLILPHKQARQFAEQIQAMRSLTAVHYEWGTAAAWNESGLSVLFAGPSGTGKTMAAEVMAQQLGLPMYRIDLSQVVNKYIGETEKNLKRIFDAADVADVVLFFDEADSLFGKRTEVSDAHDRYANLEISYLLERMERFKGLAILATNRKKDLDEAFLRRLRYVIDFPLPDETQREAIWRQVVPAGAETAELDFVYLARNFPMSGGNIRSAVFNACLQSAAQKDSRQLTMKDTLVAVKREYDKMNRAVGHEQFGHYAEVIAGLEQPA